MLTVVSKQKSLGAVGIDCNVDDDDNEDDESDDYGNYYTFLCVYTW